MTNLRQAAQQALEALEGLADYRYTDRVKNTMASLRQALAEPEQEPVAWMDIDDNGQRLTVRQWSDGNKDEVPLYTAPTPRKPEQEPMAFCNGMPAYEGALSKAQRTNLTQDLDAPLTLNGVALYPRRKPLTDEEIWNTYKNLWMFHPAEEPRLAGDVLKFARAIERAHGIGEQHE